MQNIIKTTLVILLLSLNACYNGNHNTKEGTNEAIVENTTVKVVELNFDIPYEKFTLDNGLTVILHEDHSDPIVAIATIVHVGSNREKPGRTGFAHFFEHMAFNNSENVPMGANRKMIPELGGSRNGGTWSDGTQYYEVVPKDAFEKLMWIDSDRFGYMINTVTEGTLEREKQVVKNEKRQRVDNRAYGHTGHVIRKSLYPKSHPYNWTVIGDLEDLQNATLDDVREFYKQYYIPANATLVIAGDIDMEETKKSVKLWFGEFKASPAIGDLEPMPVSLNHDIKKYHLDNFAKLPEIRITFPTIEQYHPDAYALDALAFVLSDGKKAPLFTTLVEEQKLAPAVSAYQSSSELAGTFTIRVRANAGIDLDNVQSSIKQAFEKFESQGIRENDLIKIKVTQETSFYNGISSILSKAFQLGLYNEYAGDPGFIKQDIKNILAVTEEDIIRVYDKYIKNKSAVITSFVPKDSIELIVKGSAKANIVEEQITKGSEKQFKEELNPEFVKTLSNHDRSEPPLSELPTKTVPQIWHDKTENGIKIVGIEQHELPLISFYIHIEGGQILDDSDKLGTANLLAAMMNEGTKFKTPTELEDAIGLLGSSIHISANKTGFYISGNSLKRNFQQTIDLVSEMLMNPRFDESDFQRLKSKQLTNIKSALANPNTVARNVIMQKLYGNQHVLGQVMGGDSNTVANIDLNDIKDYYKNNLSINHTSLYIAGDFENQAVINSLTKIDNNWKTKDSIKLPAMPEPQSIEIPQVYFVDFPSAKQSAIYVGKSVLNSQHPDFNLLNIVNNRLGAGSSARLTQILRIEKGYTYGAYSYVQPSNIDATFIAATQVRSNVTLESLKIIQDQIANYQDTFSPLELATTKNLIIKGNSRKFETLRQLLSVANTIGLYDYADNYLEKNQKQLENLSMEKARGIIKNNLNEQQMIYVIVGDAATQLERIEELGYGKPVVLDNLGNEVTKE